jgi:hypothetical protein
MIPIAVVMILFYSVILFGHLCWVLWVAPMRFAEKPFFNRYRFLLMKFRPDRWYWSALVYVRNSVLCFVVVIVPDYPVLQVMLFNWVMVIFFGLTLHYQPWKEPANNHVEAMLGMVLVVFSLATLPLLPSDPRLVGVLSTVILISIFCGAAIVLRVLFMCARKVLRQPMFRNLTKGLTSDPSMVVPMSPNAAQHAEKSGSKNTSVSDCGSLSEIKALHEKTAAALRDIVDHLNRISFTEMQTFVANLTLYDNRLLQQFTKLVEIECKLQRAASDAGIMRLNHTEHNTSGGNEKESESSKAEDAIPMESDLRIEDAAGVDEPR